MQGSNPPLPGETVTIVTYKGEEVALGVCDTGGREVGFFFSSRRRHTRCSRDWSSDVCSSDLSWEITAHPVTNQKPFQRGQRFRIRFHNVMPGATMNVNVNKARRKDCVLQIHDAAIRGDLAVRARAEPTDNAILDQQQGLVNPLHRCQQRCRSQRNHENLGVQRTESAFYRKYSIRLLKFVDGIDKGGALNLTRRPQ